jgi:hypothetical protein
VSVYVEQVVLMDLFTTLPINGGKCIIYSKGFFVNLKRFFYLDVRVENWSLMKDVFPSVMIGIIYFCAIIFGRKWMKNLKSFDLRYFMFIYNLLQVIICAYITYEV